MGEANNNNKFEKGAVLIQKAGNKIGCSCIVIAKALMIYHHFRHVTSALEYNDFIIGAVVLDASIVKNTGRSKFKNLVLAFYELMSTEMPDQFPGKAPPSEEEINAMKDNFTAVEFFVMHSLEFNIDYVVAYSYAEHYLVILQPWPDLKHFWANFTEFVWKFIGQFYLSKRCLHYPAQEIAFGCITLAAKTLHIDLSSVPNWTKEVSTHMDNKKLDAIVDDLFYVSNVLQ